MGDNHLIRQNSSPRIWLIVSALPPFTDLFLSLHQGSLCWNRMSLPCWCGLLYVHWTNWHTGGGKMGMTKRPVNFPWLNILVESESTAQDMGFLRRSWNLLWLRTRYDLCNCAGMKTGDDGYIYRKSKTWFAWFSDDFFSSKNTFP